MALIASMTPLAKQGAEAVNCEKILPKLWAESQTEVSMALTVTVTLGFPRS